MNKFLGIVGVLLLLVSSANLVLLVHMGGNMKEAGEKIHSAAKQLEKVQPVLQDLSSKMESLPGGKPPIGPGDEPKAKLPPTPGTGDPDTKSPPPKLPLPPGPGPK